MLDKIKSLDTAFVVVICIIAVSVLGYTDHYTEPVSLFFTGLSGYLIGNRSNTDV